LEDFKEIDFIKVVLIFIQKGFYDEEFHDYFLEELSSKFDEYNVVNIEIMDELKLII
jgi:hypothetical protein